MFRSKTSTARCTVSTLVVAELVPLGPLHACEPLDRLPEGLHALHERRAVGSIRQPRHPLLETLQAGPQVLRLFAHARSHRADHPDPPRGICRCRSPHRCSMLWSVLVLIPSRSAARVLLLLSAARVRSTNCFSTSRRGRPIGAVSLSESPLHDATGATGDVPGRILAVIMSPSQAMNARSTTLRSSRTLPGHACDMRIFSVASSTPVMRLSYLALNSSMKPVTRRGMSSTRWRSGGTARVKTLSR